MLVHERDSVAEADSAFIKQFYNLQGTCIGSIGQYPPRLAVVTCIHIRAGLQKRGNEGLLVKVLEANSAHQRLTENFRLVLCGRFYEGAVYISLLIDTIA